MSQSGGGGEWEAMTVVEEKSFGLIEGGEEVMKWIGYFRDRVADERMKKE